MDKKQAIVGNIKTILASYPVKKASLFGSFARNDYTDASDVDILLEFSEPIGLRYGSLYTDLKKAIQREPGLMTVKGLEERSAQFKESVSSSLEVIYES